MEDISQRERVLRSQGEHNRVVGSGCFDLQIECPSEPFTQGESPSSIQTNAERRMNDQLHPAGLVKEPFQYELLLRWNDAQRPERCAEIISKLGCSGISKTSFRRYPFSQILPGIGLRRLASRPLALLKHGFEALLGVES